MSKPLESNSGDTPPQRLEKRKLNFRYSLLLVILFPLICGAFINPSFIEKREIVINLSWLLLLFLPWLLSGRKFFYYLVAFLCFIVGFINLGFWVTVHNPITSANLFVVFNTNMQEAFGFANAKKSSAYLLFIPYLFLFYLSLRHPPQIKKKIRFITAPLFLAAGIWIVLVNPFQGRIEKAPFPEIINATVAFQEQMNQYKKLKDNNNFKQEAIQATALTIPHQQVYLLILGESTNRNHLGLYGYHRATSPLLSKFPGLIVYDNVVSGYSHTLESVPASLTAANLDNHLNPPESTTLLNVFDAAGFHTYWLSNQSPIGIWDNIITLMSEQADHTEFVNTAGSSSFETTLKNSFDEKLFEPLSRVLTDTFSKKLIIVHLMGTHLDYQYRYPKEFEKYGNASSDHEMWINRYDNAVLYNDFVVDSLLNILRSYDKKNQTIGGAIYLSDHGENVFDDGLHMGHDYTDTMGRMLVEIPFMVWLSPEFKNSFPQKADLILKNKHKPFVTDDLYHALIDLADIKTASFQPERSLFNKTYQANRKRILFDGVDYDKLPEKN